MPFYFTCLFLVKQIVSPSSVTCNGANLQIDKRQKCQLLSEQILCRCLKQDPISKAQTDDLCSCGTKLEQS